MTLLAPLYLLALIGLLVPVLIHLWSRNASSIVMFGSLRFLKETETRKARNLWPSQWLLLVIRCLLLAGLILVMAEWVRSTTGRSVDSVYLLDTRYKQADWLPTFVDTLTGSYEIRWIAEDFPYFDEEFKSVAADYFSILSDPPILDAARWIVISPVLQQDFRGSSKMLPVRYEWIKPPTSPQEVQRLSYEKEGDFRQVNATTDEWQTTYLFSEGDSGEPITITFFITEAEMDQDISKVFRAALATLEDLSPVSFKEVENWQDADWVFWFKPGGIPKRRKLVFADSQLLNGWSSVIPGVYRVAADMTADEALKINLPGLILDAVLASGIDASGDQITMDTAGFGFDERTSKQEQINTPVGPYLWIFIITLFLMERGLSYISEEG